MDELTPCGDAFTELVLAVFRVNRLLLDAGDRLTRPVGLSSARWQVLGVVEHGPAPVAHIARAIGLTRQNVQQIADGLERDGFIAYLANPHHRRAKLMAMTSKGDDALAYVRRRHAAWANQIGEGASLEDVRTAVAALRRVEGRLDRSMPLEEPKG